MVTLKYVQYAEIKQKIKGSPLGKVSTIQHEIKEGTETQDFLGVGVLVGCGKKGAGGIMVLVRRRSGPVHLTLLLIGMKGHVSASIRPLYNSWPFPVPLLQMALMHSL